MLVADVPSKFDLPFGEDASGGFIRAIPLTSADPTAASLTLGFPPDTGTPVGSGGTPPNIKDFNGVLNQATAWDQWFSAGAPIYYDAAFSTAIGGYPAGAALSKAGAIGSFWISEIDNNTSDPDTGGSNWLGYTLVGLGTAAYRAASDAFSANKLAAVSGSTTVGHLAIFANTTGSLQDGGAIGTLGTAAAKAASDDSQPDLASVVGGTTVNHIATFNDGSGTVKDSGYSAGSFDAAGSAATAQSNAESYAASVAATAQANAEAFATSAIAAIFSSNLSATGHICFAGLVIQWLALTVSISSNNFANQAFSFDAPFPTGCFACVATPNENIANNPNTTGNNFAAIVWGLGPSGGNVRIDTEQGGSVTSTVTVYIIAVGY